MNTSLSPKWHQTLKFCLPCAGWHSLPTNLYIRLDFNSIACFFLLYLWPIWPCSTQPALNSAFPLITNILSLAEKALHEGKWRTSTTGSSNKQSSSLDQKATIQAENRGIWEILLSVGDRERKEPTPSPKTHLPGRCLIKGRWSSRSQTQATRKTVYFWPQAWNGESSALCWSQYCALATNQSNRVTGKNGLFVHTAI